MPQPKWILHVTFTAQGKAKHPARGAFDAGGVAVYTKADLRTRLAAIDVAMKAGDVSTFNIKRFTGQPAGEH